MGAKSVILSLILASASVWQAVRRTADPHGGQKRDTVIDFSLRERLTSRAAAPAYADSSERERDF